MTYDILTNPALRSALSSFIAEAVAESDLPPLTKDTDEAFLQEIYYGIIDAFWEAYISQLGEAAQAELLEAAKDDTGEKVFVWLQTYADFETNEGARILAAEIMKDFAVKLPVIIQEAHTSYPPVSST